MSIMRGRVLIISTEFPPGPGGIGTHAYQLAVHLQRLGWEVTVLTPQDYAGGEEILHFNEAQGFRVHSLSCDGTRLKKLWQRFFGIMEEIRAVRPDVLLVSGHYAVWFTALIMKVFRVPWLAAGHGGEFALTASWKRAWTRWAYRQATIVVCGSRYTQQRMLALDTRPRASVVIHYGADDSLYRILPEEERERRREALGFGGKRLLLTVGRVTERKGQDVVIRSLPHILREMPDTHYLMAGLPEAREAFEGLARRLGVASHAHFLGRVEAETLVALQNCCDVFIMTSRHSKDGDFEGFGIAVVEAALCGAPAVVARNSGLTEAIEEGVTGYSVPEDDERETAKAVLELLANEEGRLEMGRAARERALQTQTWAHRAREYDVLLRRLCGQESADSSKGS